MTDLREVALAEFDRAREVEWAEYLKERELARVEFETARDLAWVVFDTALGEYDKARELALAALNMKLQGIPD